MKSHYAGTPEGRKCGCNRRMSRVEVSYGKHRTVIEIEAIYNQGGFILDDSK